jgi:hypothetical protein
VVELPITALNIEGGVFFNKNGIGTKYMSTASDVIATTLEHYAQRGFFRGYSRVGETGARTSYRVRWHHEKFFDIHYDMKTNSIKFAGLLPEVPSDSDMYKAFKKFVKARQVATLPDHRRIDPDKAQVKTLNRNSMVSLSLKILDDDVEYSAKKIVHLVHEVFMDFLMDGLYYDYLVEQFDLDPDAV